MKKLLLIFFIPVSYFSQNLNTVIDDSKFIGKTFSEFESNMSVTSQSSTSKFGLEKRVYKKDNIIYSIEEIQDNDTIDKISIVKMRDPKSHELWYNMIKDANKYPKLVFLKTAVTKGSDKISDKDLTLNELINYLRSENETEKMSYLVDYQLNNLYYSFAVIDNSLFITISNTK